MDIEFLLNMFLKIPYLELLSNETLFVITYEFIVGLS